MKYLNNSRGTTLLELMVATALTGVLMAAGLSFYTNMHSQTLLQEDISDMQQNSRNVLDELARTTRNAGFKIGSHVPYVINGDSLYVFFNETQPVDTVLYYLVDYLQCGLPDDLTPKKLARRINSGAPVEFADYITDISFTVPSAKTIEISLEVRAVRTDPDYDLNQGIRTKTYTQRVSLKNLNL